MYVCIYICLYRSGAVSQWLSMRTHNTALVSSIPPCVTFKTPLVRKAMGNHLMNSTSLEKTQSLVSGFCYARNRVCNAGKKYICFFICATNIGLSEKYKCVRVTKLTVLLHWTNASHAHWQRRMEFIICSLTLLI